MFIQIGLDSGFQGLKGKDQNSNFSKNKILVLMLIEIGLEFHRLER